MIAPPAVLECVALRGMDLASLPAGTDVPSDRIAPGNRRVARKGLPRQFA